MSTDDLDRILQVVQNSQDIRRASDLGEEDVAELLNLKLLDNLDVGGFRDVIEDAKDELRAEVDRLCVQHGFAPGSSKQMAAALAQEGGARLHLRNLTEAMSICARIESEHSLDGDDALLIEACNLMLLLARIRVQRDVVPLVTRGLYSAQIDEALAFWRAHRNSAEGKAEELWQKELSCRPEILSRVLGGHVVVMGEQQHVGGANLKGRGGRITDYLGRHEITRNVTLIEIKTPQTRLLGTEYRGTYPLSQDLSGSVSQVLCQRSELMKNYFSKHHGSAEKFEVNAASCVILAGSAEQELAGDEDKANAFEMQRDALSSRVRIVTFDELYQQLAVFNRRPMDL